MLIEEIGLMAFRSFVSVDGWRVMHMAVLGISRRVGNRLCAILKVWVLRKAVCLDAI